MKLEVVLCDMCLKHITRKPNSTVINLKGVLQIQTIDNNNVLNETNNPLEDVTVCSVYCLQTLLAKIASTDYVKPSQANITIRAESSNT